MSLINDTIEAVRSLTLLLEEETGALAIGVRDYNGQGVAEQKAHFADRVQDLTEAMKRAGRQAIVAEPLAAKNALDTALKALQQALDANARMLERRKLLSEGLIAAVLAEAKRQAGTQLNAYGTQTPRPERAAAIAYNTNV